MLGPAAVLEFGSTSVIARHSGAAAALPPAADISSAFCASSADNQRERYAPMIRTIRRSISRLITARASRAAPVNIDLSDLLGRAPVNLSTPELQRFLAGKVVLVTGAGGSIGSEIARQAMKFCPARLILLDRAENALFEIDRELNHRWLAADVVPVVADVCDAGRVSDVFQTHRPHVIFHAAAHKHVPMMELNPGEA